jgi:two-component system response regulator MprA
MRHHHGPVVRDGNGQGAILVVDDEQDILDMLRELLSAEGYDVLMARDGIEALAVVERARPSLILLDMRMPRMDGWRFAEEVRRRGVATPIVVMTAAQSARKWADEIRADDHIAKPFNIDEILAKVERLHPPLN